MFINPIKNGYFPNGDGVKFGNRIINGKKEFHYGVDLVRNETAIVEVLAAADGTVSDVWPESKSTYGNVIFITHTINKKTYTTVYAHLKTKSVMVKKGDKVKQGQQIGIMGSTGRSYGAHLHFELHEGKWVSGRPNAVNPEKYIELYTKAEVQKMSDEFKKLKEKVETLTNTLNTLKSHINIAEEIENAVALELEKVLPKVDSIEVRQSPAERAVRRAAIAEIKAAVKDGRFQSEHKNLENYSTQDLQFYALTALLKRK